MNTVLGSWYVVARLLTICTADDAWYPVAADAGATERGAVMVNVEHVSPGVLRYVGAYPIVADVLFTGSVASVNTKRAYQIAGVALTLNGSPIEETRVDTLVTNNQHKSLYEVGTRPYAYVTTTQALIVLEPGDELGVALRNVTPNGVRVPGTQYAVDYGQLTVRQAARADGAR